jgi:hypothetical protein
VFLMKKFISGFILSALLFSIIPIYATTQQAINVSYKNIKISVNGKIVPTDTEPFIYNNQAFASVKSIAEAFGKDVKYNESTGIVAITDVAISTPDPKVKLDSAASLKAFLEENYSSLATDMGTTTFKFEIRENKINLISYDYRVMAYFDHRFFDHLKYSTTVDSKTRENVKAQIKKHQESLANALMSAMPNKKFFGGYYYKSASGSSAVTQKGTTEPSSQINLDYYFSWTNYTGSILAKYQDARLSAFRWYSSIDDEI